MVRRLRHVLATLGLPSQNWSFPLAQSKAVRTLDCARGFHLESFDACWMKTITGARMGDKKLFEVLSKIDGCSEFDYPKEV